MRGFLFLTGRSFIAEEIAVQQFLDADRESDSRGKDYFWPLLEEYYES